MYHNYEFKKNLYFIVKIFNFYIKHKNIYFAIN